MREKGFDCIHTLDLFDKNRTGDNSIISLSMKEERIVITKDKDFVSSFLLEKKPYKLIAVTAGNLSNDDLISIFSKNLESITGILSDHSFLEINRESLTTHS